MENMEKKRYETPDAEKMMFNYRDQVVAASTGCGAYFSQYGEKGAGCNSVVEEHMN